MAVRRARRGSWRPFWLVAAALAVFLVLDLRRCPAVTSRRCCGWSAIVAVLGHRRRRHAVGPPRSGRCGSRPTAGRVAVGRERVPLTDIDAAHLREVDSGVDAGAPVLGGGWSLPQGPHRPAAAAAPTGAPCWCPPATRRRLQRRPARRPRPTPPTGPQEHRDTGVVTSLDSSPYTYEAPVVGRSSSTAAAGDHAGRGEQPGARLPGRRRHARGSWSRAPGPWLTDADGRRYVDLVSSWGPMILGHAHPAVVEAVTAAARRGLTFGAPTEGELDLAEEIRDRVAPVERVRLVNSGTEAVLSARPAGPRRHRPPAGREVRRLLPRPRRRAARLGRLRRRDPRPARHPRRHHRRRRRHRRPALQRRRRRRGRLRRARATEIACVITEAAAGQHGRRPAAGRLQRRRCAGSPPRTARC